MKKIIIINLLVFIFSLFFVEIALRVKLFKKMQDHFTSGGMIWFQSQGISKTETIVDSKLGITVESPETGLFRSNSQIDISVVSTKKSLGQQNFSVKTNNVGLFSEYDYTFKRSKDLSEYRIIMLGESFTAPTTSTYQWVDTLEDLLNFNNDLKNFLGVKKIKVYNHGWIGGGFNTFWREYDEVGRYFDGDLAIINYLELDFPRYIGPQIEENNIELMISNAASNVEKISKEINTLLTIMPDYHSLDRNVKYDKSKKLAKLFPDLKFIDMRDFLPLHDIKKAQDEWFNIPYDGHYSDRGGEIYARVLANEITKFLFNKDHDYFKYETKYSKYVMGEKKPRTRIIENSVSNLTESREDYDKVFRYVKKSYYKSRLLRVRPYILDVIQKTGYDGITPPLSRPLIQDIFYEFTFGTNNTKALMTIICEEGKGIDLSSPYCYTFMHTFVSTN